MSQLFGYKCFDQSGSFKENTTVTIPINEEGTYKLFVRNSATMLKQSFQLKIKYFELNQEIEKEMTKSFSLQMDQVPCTLKLDFSASGVFQLSKSFEVVLFQEYENCKELSGHVNSDTKLGFKVNAGIYRLFIENRSEKQTSSYEICLDSLSFSFPLTIIQKGEKPFLSPPIPVFKSQEPVAMKMTVKSKDAIYLIVLLKYLNSESVISDIEKKDDLKRNLKLSLKNKDLKAITELMQDDKMRDVEFYSAMKEEINQCKDLLREANLGVNTLKEANETLSQVEIEFVIDKFSWLASQDFPSWQKTFLESQSILDKMSIKKSHIESLNSILEEDLREENLAILQNLRREAFEVLQAYKTDDPSENDILELVNQTIQLLEDMKQFEIEKKNRETNLKLKLEELILKENKSELDIFLKENAEFLPKSEFEKGTKFLHALIHEEEIRLGKYLETKATQLECKRASFEAPKLEIPKQHQRTSSYGVPKHERVPSLGILQEKSFYTEDTRRKCESTSTSPTNTVFRPMPTMSSNSSFLPPGIKQLHRSTVTLLKMSKEIYWREPFKDDLDLLVSSALEILDQERRGSFFSSAKSILDIISIMDKNLVGDFFKTKGYWLSTQDVMNKKATNIVLVKYLLQKKRYVNIVREIVLNTKFKTYYTEKSVLNDKLTKDEILCVLDLLNELSFVFPDFEEERDKTELKQPEMKQITSKKKKAKQNLTLIKSCKEIVGELEEYFLQQSKTKTSIEIGSEDFVVQLVLMDLIPVIMNIFADGIKEDQHVWKLISEVSNTSVFCKENISIVKQKLEKKSLSPDLLLVTLIKVVMNASQLAIFLQQVCDAEIFDSFYEKGAILNNVENLDKVYKYMSKIDRLPIKIPY